MKKYALLFAGCIDADNNYKRYSNDLAYMNEVLKRNNYERIDVLYSDGSVIDYNGNLINSIEGSLNNFQRMLSEYESLIDKDDLLFIMISNHGGPLNGDKAGINCWGKDFISQSEFSESLCKINGTKVVVFGQCYGGNFLVEDIPNSILISANSSGEFSYGSFNVDYDEFLYHFISFYNEEYPDGTPLTSTNIVKDICSAFDYAKNNDYHYLNNTPWYHSATQQHINIHEEPQIKINVSNPRDIHI
jgi:hypothetical protein